MGENCRDNKGSPMALHASFDWAKAVFGKAVFGGGMSEIMISDGLESKYKQPMSARQIAIPAMA
jgi:hypothetical protein